MSIRHTTFAIFAVAATVAATPATAGSVASASLTQFGYTLFDLNTADGITPSVSFSLGSSPYGSYVQSSATDPSSGSQSNTGWSLTAFGPASVSSVAGLASSQASVSGSVETGSLAYQVSGAALGSTLTPLSTQFTASASGSNFGSLGFSLSPFTLIVFNGTADLLAQTTQGLNPVGFLSESSSANVALSVSSVFSSGNPASQNASDNRSLFATFTSSFNPVTGQVEYAGQTLTLDNVPLSVAFTNFSAAELSGQISVSASVGGGSPLAPIPEPGSVALWMAGLAGLGLWVRRRR